MKEIYSNIEYGFKSFNQDKSIKLDITLVEGEIPLGLIIVLCSIVFVSAIFYPVEVIIGMTLLFIIFS